MNTISGFRLCTLTNKELVKKVDEMTDGLFDVEYKHMRDRNLTRHIPAQPNNDYDLLIGELLLRFQEITEALEEAIIGLEWWNDKYRKSSSKADLNRIEKWKELVQGFCDGKCGSNYCDEHGCIDKKETVVENNNLNLDISL